jgi:SAM-dependent methyltransferase
LIEHDVPAPILEFSSLPFYIGLLDATVRYDLPECLPFALGIHPSYGIPRLLLNDTSRAAIDKAYSLGSMCSTPLGESGLATNRMTEFEDRLEAVLGGVKGKRLLEIGCGNGELLHQLRLKGAIVTGLEIGPQADVVEARYGIRVIREPLTAYGLNETFDCILSYGCLEHIEALDEFFAGSRACLTEGGLFFHSVPNSALAFDQVYLEHLQHEHVNYFTPHNATALLDAQGFRSADFALTAAGNELMAWGFHDSGAALEWPHHRVEAETAALGEYAGKVVPKMESTLSALRQAADAGTSIGFYAGGYQYGYFLGATPSRYFDGDTYKHGKRWLERLAPIESPEAFRLDPVDRLVISKAHYFEVIRDALIRQGADARRLVSIDDIDALRG